MKFPSKTHGIGWMAPCLTSHHPGLNGLRKTRAPQCVRQNADVPAPYGVSGGGKRGSRPESRVPLAQGDLFPFFLFGYKLYQVISIKESPVLSLESSYLPKIYLTRWCPAVFAGFEATELWFQIPKP